MKYWKYWRDRWNWRSSLPRTAIAAHDLFMVWVVWQALHRLRFGVMPDPLELPLWSTSIALVLAAQGLVFWLLTLAAFVMQVFALVDAARHPAQAYAAAGKLTKQKWLIILGVATAVGFVSLGNGGLLFLVSRGAGRISLDHKLFPRA